MSKEQLLLAMVRSTVCGESLSDGVVQACTPEMLEDVCALAYKHDLLHLVGQALSKKPVTPCEALEKSKKAAMQAFMRYVQRNHEYVQVCAILEDAKIPYIPLKGTVLREYYPEAWMRTSCDTDILVKEENLDAATALLVEKMGYRAGTSLTMIFLCMAPEAIWNCTMIPSRNVTR